MRSPTTTGSIPASIAASCALDLPVDLAELAGDLLAGAVAARLLVAGEGAAFGLEVTDRLRAEDPGGEEGAERQGREPVRS